MGLYLKPNVLAEPMIDRWYAVPNLIAPPTTARSISERHLKIFDSYVASPQMHQSAAKNPKLAGGPFMDYPAVETERVKQLRDDVIRNRGPLLEFSKAIGELDEMLIQKADGHSLEPLYKNVPEALKGYVELVYDLHHHASFRFIEPLLYKSRFYDVTMQSVGLSLIKGDDRPFVLSTPRLDAEGFMEARVPFRDNAIDTLFRAKRTPSDPEELRENLKVPAEKETNFRSLFSETPPRPYAQYDGKGIRWRYFGHACILVESGGISILIDPVLSYTYESNVCRYTYEDIPDKLDYVLITHNHQDHVMLETLLQLRHRIGTIVVPRNSGGFLQDPSLKLILENCGFDNVIEVTEMQELKEHAISITSIPFLGEHADLSICTKTGYIIRIDGHSLLFAADSNNIEPAVYKHIQAAVGDVDALFLGMECDGAPLSWLYGAFLTKPIDRGMDQSRRVNGSNCERGMPLVEQFACKEVYIYAMGMEPWLRHIMKAAYTDESNPIIQSNKLIERCREKGLVAERLFGEKQILIGN